MSKDPGCGVNDQKERELAVENECLRGEIRQLLHVIRHDFQAPVRTIRSFGSLLSSTDMTTLSAEQSKLLGHLLNGASRMTRLLDAATAYAGVHCGDGPLLNVSSEECAATALQRLEQRSSGALEATTIETSLPTLPADKAQLTTVFEHLLENAMRYVDQAPPKVVVGCEQQHDAWCFTVADEGIGIEPEHRQEIFTLFSRLHTTDEYPGVGAGLAISRQIVQRHRGRMWVDANTNRGSIFKFTIPVRASL